MSPDPDNSVAQHRAAVLGSPIAHSLSPAMHTAAYRALGLTNWSYEAFDVGRDQLHSFVAALGSQWRGLSLTMPLKEVAFSVAADTGGTVSEVASAAGAINTLVHRGGGIWDATNTDVAGIVGALPATPSRARGAVLGAGATARSAILALQQLGLSEIVVAARRSEALDELAHWAAVATQPGLRLHRAALADWASVATDVVISTLPPAGGEAVAAALLRTSGDAWRGRTLLDVVYQDWPTPLAAAAASYGMRTIRGDVMLAHQGAAQFELFTGRRVPVDVMLTALP